MMILRSLLPFAFLLASAHAGRSAVKYPPAEFCNPATLEGCKGRQAEFAEKMRRKTLAQQRYELKKLKRATRYEDESQWIDDRLIILENVIEYTIATRGDPDANPNPEL